ncbi:MAG TPA: F0F1 ATP synthase subunit B [Acidimicrobiales bacterium]|nr:F0F1 ATP synthase subunit B [Acidimicrobiales bacterium]
MPIATSNFLVPNGTFIVELIAFVLVLAIVAKYALPPVNKALSERQNLIRGELEAADEAKADAEAADHERRETLEHARQQAREIVEQASRTAETVLAEGHARASAEHDRIVGSATAEIDLARQRAVEEAASRIGELVLDVVERIIGREVDAAAHRDLIDEAIEALSSEAGTGGASAGAASRS